MEQNQSGSDAHLDETRYAELIGKRAERYLARFRRFASRGEWLSWNWAAFFGTLAWLRYRRLYRWSWLYFFVSTPMLIIGALSLKAGDACQSALNPAIEHVEYAIEALIAASWLVPPLFADRLYFAEVRRLASTDQRPTPAGSSAIVATLAVQALVFIVVAVFLPGYASYSYRARVNEALSLASAARAPVYDYFLEHRAFPARLDGIAPASSTYVRSVELVDRGTLRATFSERAARLAGHTVSMVPAWKENAIVAWTCRSDDLPNACLPASCRR
ncbi:MAG TPA: pilin [Burkholderiales bacterium]|nr:pilin [Burkholderiales bacterium]